MTAERRRWRGANLKAAAGEEHNTALMVAAMGGHTQVMALLIESGAVVEMVNSEGKTPLIKASELGYVDACKALIDGGADINRGDRSGRPSTSALLW
mmetsp:Transcript_97884/g.146804  ORF Transcript_97884/g.146804 Transcript_97884/m.146804 type:complete len:97 (+) Transcript_97884:66-356(+)